VPLVIDGSTAKCDLHPDGDPVAAGERTYVVPPGSGAVVVDTRTHAIWRSMDAWPADCPRKPS
jgi:hypothetical protein